MHMQQSQIKEPRTLKFTVAEVEDFIESLDAAKRLRHLSGDQRQQLQETLDEFVDAINDAENGDVYVHSTTFKSALRCGVMTQMWLSTMLEELSDDNS
jgi:hypothetical protein